MAIEHRSYPQSALTIEAKSIEQALVKAAASLGVTQDEVNYQIVREATNKGLLAFFKTPIVEIKAWVKTSQTTSRGRSAVRDGEGERQGNASRPERSTRREREERTGDEDGEGDGQGVAKAEPLPPEKVAALTTELEDFCAGICSHMVGETVTVSSTVDNGRLVLNLQSNEFAQLIARNSKLAEAMEHILRKKPRHLRQELPFRIFVDVNGLRRKREEDLVQMAHDLSAKVHENKRPIVLNYKSSYDRKIIHMALDKDQRVYTKSIGSGPNRKLMILPSKGGVVDDQVDYIDDEGNVGGECRQAHEIDSPIGDVTSAEHD